jgi:hypothetical protein
LADVDNKVSMMPVQLFSRRDEIRRLGFGRRNR